MATTTVPKYISRLTQLGEREDHIGRYYVAQSDANLAEIAEEIAAAGQFTDLHNALLRRYRSWRDEMGPEKWGEMEGFNASLSDADRNWLLSEELSEGISLMPSSQG